MVNFEKGRAKPHKRRAISTIVGGAIFLVLFTSALSTFFIAMDFQRDSINTQRSISESMMEKTKEKFAISASTDPVDRLGIQVKNQGTNPVEIATVWIVTKSGSFPANQYDIDYLDSNIPPGYGADILENTPVVLLPDDYDIKVVSVLGTIEKAKLTVGGANNLRAKLISIPPDVKVGQNVTMTMHVENIGSSTLLNVVPFNDVSMDNYPDINLPFTSPVPPPAKPVDLDPGEGTFFTWEYVTTGSANAEIIFEGYATSTEEDTGFIKDSNFAREKIRLQEPDESELIVLEKDLFSRPELFLVIPAPMGTADDTKGVWGANIVNPTNAPMEVSRLTITLLSPRENNSDLMFNPTTSGPKKCDPEAVGPTNTADWKCLVQNQLSWTNLAAPVTIPPFSSHQFTAFVHTNRLSSCCPEVPAVIVVADVFTNLGEFSKAGYSSSFDDGGTAIVNVYLSTGPWLTDDDDIITNRLAIPSTTPITLYATLTDFEKGDSVIEAGSKFIVNIPRDWTIVDWMNDVDGFGDFTIIYNPWPDGSSQIVGELIAPYDGTVCCARTDPGEEGLTIEFLVTPPTVTNERMYVMYILAGGQIDAGDFSMGPLSEVVLQVIP